jgi:acetoin utilization deacetylase AcuC-like enzyme
MTLPLAYAYPAGHRAHHQPGHPERPDRIEAITGALNAAGFWEGFPLLEPLDVPERVLLGVHTAQHLANMRSLAGQAGMLTDDTYVKPETSALAFRAAGGAAAAAGAVWRREARSGFALCRPPGHHATPDQAMGFCLLNNAAIAAEYLLQECGAQKIAVVDMDLHHGNGTQDIFYERDDVLFISTHQYSLHPIPFYPGTGGLDETGAGRGAGCTLNIPFPPHSGDRAFRAAMAEVILPLLGRFAPEMILISAGLDAHWRDPLGQLLLSAGTYGWLIRQMAQFADERCEGRIALMLEGGYDLLGGGACAVAAVSALLDAPFTDPAGPAPQAEGEAWRGVLDGVKEIHHLQGGNFAPA